MDLTLTQDAATIADRGDAAEPLFIDPAFPADKPLTGRKILVVEDEMMVLMHAEDMLLDLGCRQVVAAASVKQALALIETEAVDAALLDVNLNGDWSFPIADALARRGTPFVFATGYGSHGLRETDIGRPVLMKPYPLDELVKAMTGLFD